MRPIGILVLAVSSANSLARGIPLKSDLNYQMEAMERLLGQISDDALRK